MRFIINGKPRSTKTYLVAVGVILSLLICLSFWDVRNSVDTVEEPYDLDLSKDSLHRTTTTTTTSTLREKIRIARAPATTSAIELIMAPEEEEEDEEEEEKDDPVDSSHQNKIDNDPVQESFEQLENSIDAAQVKLIEFNLVHSQSSQSIPYGFVDEIESAWKRVYEYISRIQVQDIQANTDDFKQLGRYSRALFIAYLIQTGSSQPPSSSSSSSSLPIKLSETQHQNLEKAINHLTKQLFPWLPSSFTSIHHLHQTLLKTNESGIVITTGKKHIKYAIHGIKTLRTLLNCTLPIEVHYAGNPQDLDDPSLALLSNLTGTHTDITSVNLQDFFPAQETTAFKGSWSVKPFAILASRFRRAVFMDADVLFFKDPSHVILHESHQFQKYGQVFYHDRTMNRGSGGTESEYSKWFRSVTPQPYSRYAKDLRWVNGLSWHEQEAGVVALDKGRAGILFGLLLACKMNSEDVKAETYSHVWGDKETFWMSLEMLRVPFAFVPGFSGALGYLVDVPAGDGDGGGGVNISASASDKEDQEKQHKQRQKVCGSNFHVDQDMKPFWWNGGVLLIRRESDSVFMRFEYAAYDGERDTEKWENEQPGVPFCLTPMYPEKEVMELSVEEKRLGEAYISMYEEMGESM
ncbi:mannosyltransferase putative-domain-containing protein [Obelidium mucronatum]|nr:mannosyltransferase putative-domain-containing protein [Obelidium mucronatum]